MTSALDLPLPAMAYHITPAKCLGSIMQNGLVPAIGERSAAAREQEAAVYLFRTLMDAEDALMGWLGDEFEDATPLAILEIDAAGLALVATTGFELSCSERIQAARIRVRGYA